MPKGSRSVSNRKSSTGRAARNRAGAARSSSSVPSDKISSPGAVSAASLNTPKQVLPQFPHIAGELRRLGIIAGSLLVVMVILSLVV